MNSNELLQAILIPHDWDKKQIKDLLEEFAERGEVPIKDAHITKDYIRYRVREPHKDYKYRTLHYRDGSKLIVYSKKKKKYTCTTCGMEGHNSSNKKWHPKK